MDDITDILIEYFTKSVHIPTLKRMKNETFMNTIHMLDLYNEETENAKHHYKNSNRLHRRDRPSK